VPHREAHLDPSRDRLRFHKPAKLRGSKALGPALRGSEGRRAVSRTAVRARPVRGESGPRTPPLPYRSTIACGRASGEWEDSEGHFLGIRRGLTSWDIQRVRPAIPRSARRTSRVRRRAGVREHRPWWRTGCRGSPFTCSRPHSSCRSRNVSGSTTWRATSAWSSADRWAGSRVRYPSAARTTAFQSVPDTSAACQLHLAVIDSSVHSGAVEVGIAWGAVAETSAGVCELATDLLHLANSKVFHSHDKGVADELARLLGLTPFPSRSSWNASPRS
jgi:hypothetical protein